MSYLSILNKNVNGYIASTRIGQGGMGEVYAAVHEKTGRKVAIKVLLHEKGSARFRNEARLQANVNHPNIVKLYDIVEVEGRLALILEFVEGIDLDDYLDQNPMLSTFDKLQLFKGMAKAIGYLHERSITHRDIKPSNIKVQPNGEIKLLDFGIAKGYSSPTITQAGQTIGTLDYMSPERIKGFYTAQSDIWSLGVILYEMMVGRNPFKTNTETATRRAIQKGEYKRLDKLPTQNKLEGEVSGIINKCLQLSQEKRYANGNQLLGSVDRLLKYGSRMTQMQSIQNTIPLNISKSIKWASLLLILIAGFFLLKPILNFQNSKIVPSNISTVNNVTNPVSLIIKENTNAKAYVILPDKTRCQIPCEIIREKDTKLNIKIVAEGYTSQEATIQFNYNRSIPYTLR